MAGNHKELKVWNKSYKLCLDVYKICKQIPNEEKFGLIDQVKRSSVSIPSNIAEGHQRNSSKEFKQFLGIAKGSSAELETQLLLIKDIHGIEVQSILEDIDEIQRMIQSLINQL